MEIDMNKVCRVCLHKGNMMSVFKVNISKKLMSCATIQVWPNDGLPHQICKKCSAKLHISYQFKKLCEKSDSKLREILLKMKESQMHSQLETSTCPTSQTNENNPRLEALQLPQTAVSTAATTINSNTNNLYIECVPIIQNYEPNLNLFDNTQTTQNQECNLQNFNNVAVNIGVYQINEQLNQQIQEIHDEIRSNVMQQQEIQPVPVQTVQETQFVENCRAKNEKKLTKVDTKCTICGKILTSASKLNRHMATHNKDPAYKCAICSKGFSHSGNYKVHMRMHNDEKPFKCSTCGHGSRQQADIEKHMRTHTGERPHACHLCSKAFATRSNLIAHIRTHTGERPYVCCVCQKGFCQSNELTKHMRTHTGEKSHVCDVCQKGFNGASSLKAHRRLHTGEKPYCCAVCNKAFAQSQTLKVHMKVHF